MVMLAANRGFENTHASSGSKAFEQNLKSKARFEERAEEVRNLKHARLKGGCPFSKACFRFRTSNSALSAKCALDCKFCSKSSCWLQKVKGFSPLDAKRMPEQCVCA